MTDRLRRYEQRSSVPLLVLALLFIFVYALQIIDPGLPPGVHDLLDLTGGVIWVAFAVDLVVRVTLAERRWHFLATHPVDVLAVALPALRPLRVLRVFTVGHSLVTQAGRFSLLRTTQAVTVAAGLLVFISALAVLDAERGVKDANITSIGDALWWAATTVTTVGYGDRFPVSAVGRMVAVALMFVGISIFGVVTASVAAWFVSQTASAVAVEEAELQDRLRRIEEQLVVVRLAVLEKKTYGALAAQCSGCQGEAQWHPGRPQQALDLAVDVTECQREDHECRRTNTGAPSAASRWRSCRSSPIRR